MTEPQRWHRHWTREGRDPFAGFAMREEGLEDWSSEQTRGWRSLAQDGESIPQAVRRAARDATGLVAGRGWIDPADLDAFSDELIYGLVRGALVWNLLRPAPQEPLPLTFYEASLRLGDRLMREALHQMVETGDAAAAQELGVPTDVVARARAGQMPPALEIAASEGDEMRRRGWMRISLHPVADASVVFVNPAPWAEPVSGGFDLPSFRHAVRLAGLVAASGEGEARVAVVNIAGALLTLGMPFDSPRGLGISASLIALVRGEAGELARSLGLGAARESESEEVYMQFPDASRPQAGRLEPMRWRDAALGSLRASEGWDGIKISGECDPQVESLLGGSAIGLGSIRAISGRDGEAGLRAIGYEQIQLEHAWEAIERGESPDFLSEEQAQVLRGMTPAAWGQVHPQAQIRRALDLAPLLDGPVDAVVGAAETTSEMRAMAVEAADRGGAASVVLFGRPPVVQAAASVAMVEEATEISLCRGEDGTIGFNAPGASANELALIQAVLGSATLDLSGTASRLPQDDSLAGRLRAELERLV